MWIKEAPALTVARGSKGSGKTDWLIERLSRVLSDGADPADLVVFAASPSAAAALAQRIECQLGCEVKVSTPMQLAADVLSTQGNASDVKPAPRIILPHERSMLLEDLKTSGMKPGRLKAMLEFFEHSWMDAVPSSEFLEYRDEYDLHELCASYLAFYGGTLSSEAPLRALDAIKASAHLRSAFARPFVFVDDAQLLSKASQRLLLAITKEGLFSTIDPEANFAVYERYPSDPRLAWIGGSVLPDDIVLLESKPKTPARYLDEASPEDELSAIVASISALISENPYARMYVACPNKTWKAMIAGSLQKAGLNCFVTGRESILTRRATDPSTSAPVKAASLLMLAANPADSMAWRSLLGCDVHLSNSAGVAALREALSSRCVGFVEAVEAACAAEAAGELSELLPEASKYALASARDIVTRYRAAKLVLAKLEGLSGPELVAELCKAVYSNDAGEARQLASIIAQLAGAGSPLAERGATELAQGLVASVLYPTPPESARIIVGDYAGITGLSPDHVFMTGAVEGFIIDRRFFSGAETNEEKKQAEIAKRRAMVYQTLGGACPCTVSSFKTLPAEHAERWGARICRISAKTGKRMALVARSELVDPYVKA